MIPAFKNSDTMSYILKWGQETIIHRNDCPNDEVYEDLKGYDRAFFFFKKRHAFAGFEEKGKY
ncbi:MULTISPECIES: hypothetical protein [Fibrobacter]|uniref:Uncharacterized protein n=1 Tax=Fibrobacter intestinalis TaxID=28122 RepID=A0A1T4RNG4_9BACT|nr:MULTISPECIES: hypothetical protein [Fibrobacter]PBC72458.1 hypothetical protein BGW94_0025 [Fibrobacter sp. NR9]SKA17555.1 hypothetical protein SAMN02745108_02787 [Fibrobacter intestinalis]